MRKKILPAALLFLLVFTLLPSTDIYAGSAAFNQHIQEFLEARARRIAIETMLAESANNSAHLPIVDGIPSQEILQQWVDAWPGLTDFEQYVLQFVNEYRAENDLPPLELCPVLSALAWYRVSYLRHNGFVRTDVASGDVHYWGSHTTNDIARFGRIIADDGRAGTFGVNFQARTARTSAYEQARVTVDGWIESPGHRANMLNERRETSLAGAGTALSVDGNRTYIYMFFGVNG